MYCKNCGNRLNSDDKFCSKCGTEVIVELPKTTEPESMFLGQKSEPTEKKPKRVIHLDEFNWNLEGYPTTPRKTEDVDFNWASVLEENSKKTALERHQVEEEKPVVRAPLEEPVIKEPLEESVAEAVSEETVEETQQEASKESAEPVLEKNPMDDFESLEQIFKEIGTTPIEEPTKLIDKAQLKAESVDRFYVFNKKQAEFQALLDQEYERIQNGLLSKSEKSDIVDRVEKEDEDNTQQVEEVSQPEVQAIEPNKVETPTLDEELSVPVELPKTEMIAVVWAKPPAGMVVQTKEASVEEKDPASYEPVLEPAPEPVFEPVPEPVFEAAFDSSFESTFKLTSEPEKELENAVEVSAEPVEMEEAEKSNLTFADIFRDDDEDEPTEKEGNFLKIVAIILCVLVIIELCILGVQHFAPNSGVSKLINRAYSTVLEFFTDTEETEESAEMEGSSEIEQTISSQIEKNENIVTVIQNSSLLFEEGEDYDYDEFANTYAFRNSPWYDTEEGTTVTFGDEIIGTLIQYYSALPDKINDVNNDVVDFIDKTSDFYEEVDGIEGIDDKEYVIEQLEIGELRTGGSGFYVLTRVTTEDKENPDGIIEKQIVYLEPNTSKKVMKIIEIKTI